MDWNSFPNPEIGITIVAYKPLQVDSGARGATRELQVAVVVIWTILEAQNAFKRQIQKAVHILHG